MWFFFAGVALLAGILGLFWAKDRFSSPALHRVAYHELTARLAIVAGALILIGALVAGADLLDLLGIGPTAWRR